MNYTHAMLDAHKFKNNHMRAAESREACKFSSWWRKLLHPCTCLFTSSACLCMSFDVSVFVASSKQQEIHSIFMFNFTKPLQILIPGGIGTFVVFED